LTQAENGYREQVFLGHLRDHPDRSQDRYWSEHQTMQLAFLRRRGLRASSTVLDLGCGPMRLGSVLIPELIDGHYYGQDLNPETLAFGEEVLRQAGIPEGAPYTLFASEQFNLAAVERPIQIAFSNSLFSHLNLNSILTCLLQVKRVLAPAGVLYSTFFAALPDQPWIDAQLRTKWGQTFSTYPHQDPYHYPPALLGRIAAQAGFRVDFVHDFGHPTQTMARFRQRRSWW
jgi:SAM-dependent methyltransferase